MSAPLRGGAGAAASRRILEAAVRVLVRDGVADGSLGAIAQDAGVSKALLHYHFLDRERLLAAAVVLLGDRVRLRERDALRNDEGDQPVDALWRWLGGELRRGELRLLLELGALRSAPVRAAALDVARERQAAAGETVGETFTRLGLVPRVAAELVAAAWVTFVDGVAVGLSPRPDGPTASSESRVAFDVFWLAALGLAD